MGIDGRLHLDDGDSLPCTVEAVQVGDFISSKDCPVCCGPVTRIGSVPYGQAKLAGFWVRMANGREDFISRDDVAIMGLDSDA